MDGSTFFVLVLGVIQCRNVLGLGEAATNGVQGMGALEKIPIFLCPCGQCTMALKSLKLLIWYNSLHSSMIKKLFAPYLCLLIWLQLSFICLLIWYWYFPGEHNSRSGTKSSSPGDGVNFIKIICPGGWGTVGKNVHGVRVLKNVHIQGVEGVWKICLPPPPGQFLE